MKFFGWLHSFEKGQDPVIEVFPLFLMSNSIREFWGTGIFPFTHSGMQWEQNSREFLTCPGERRHLGIAQAAPGWLSSKSSRPEV